MSEQTDAQNSPESPLDPYVQIQEIIEKARVKEAGNTPRISLYRAITGPGKYTEGRYIFEGVEEDRIRKYGFFENNKSSAQFEYDSTSRKPDEYNPNRRVPGLPVFLNLSEALHWLKDRKFARQPVIAVLDLPLSVYSGLNQEVRLMKNYLVASMQDQEVSPEELERHFKGIAPIKGECYLRGLNPDVPESVKQYQIIVRPVELNEDGSINTASGFEEFITQNTNTKPA